MSALDSVTTAFKDVLAKLGMGKSEAPAASKAKPSAAAPAAPPEATDDKPAK